MNFYKISKFFLILSTISLIFRNGYFLSLKPFEILFSLGAISGLFYFFPKNTDKLKIIDKKIYWALLIFISSILLATSISYFRYGIGLGYEGLSFLLRFLIVIAAFILFHIYAKEDKMFFKNIWLSFLAPLVFSLFMIFPELAYRLPFAKADGRFYGFAEGPVITAIPLIISFSFIFSAFLNAFYEKRKSAILYFLLSVANGALLLWTQSRSFWLGTIGIILLISALMAIYKKPGFKYFALNIVLAAAMMAAAFFILPSPVKIMLLLRIYPQYTTNYHNEAKNFDNFTPSDLTELKNKIGSNEAIPTIIYDQPRPKMWAAYLRVIARNPLGIGLNRTPEMLTAIKTIYQSTHNLFLDIAVWGGMGALASFLYLIYAAILNTENKLKEKNGPYFIYHLGIGAALLGLMIASNFESLTFARSIWILLAMALI